MIRSAHWLAFSHTGANHATALTSISNVGPDVEYTENYRAARSTPKTKDEEMSTPTVPVGPVRFAIIFHYLLKI